MRPAFSTVHVPPREAVDYWQDVACATITKHSPKFSDPEHFYGSMEADALSDLSLIRYRCSPGVSEAPADDHRLLIPPATGVRVQFAGGGGLEHNRSRLT